MKLVPPIQHAATAVEKVLPVVLSLVNSPLPKPVPPQVPIVLFVRTMGMNVARHRRATASMAVVHHLLRRRVPPASR